MSVPEPFVISIPSAMKASTPTTWSAPVTETSRVSMRSSMIRTRAPPSPRMTGRPMAAPNEALCTPGSLPIVAPMFSAALRLRSAPPTTSLICAKPSPERGCPTTRTSSRWPWP